VRRGEEVINTYIFAFPESLKEDIVSAYGKKVHQSQMASQILCDSIPSGSEHCLQDMTQHPKVLLVAQKGRISCWFWILPEVDNKL